MSIIYMRMLLWLALTALLFPQGAQGACVTYFNKTSQKSYTIYHYWSDANIPGQWWSCVYNNLQTMLEVYKQEIDSKFEVPTLTELLKPENLECLLNKDFIDKHKIGLVDKDRPAKTPADEEQTAQPIKYALFIGGKNHENREGTLYVNNQPASQTNEPAEFGDLWIEPGNLVGYLTAKKLPIHCELIAYYPSEPDKQCRDITRIKGGQKSTYEKIIGTSTLNKKIKTHFAKPKALPIIIDDTQYSYLIMDMKGQKYVQVDPHSWMWPPNPEYKYQPTSQADVLPQQGTESKPKPVLMLFPTWSIAGAIDSTVDATPRDASVRSNSRGLSKPLFGLCVAGILIYTIYYLKKVQARKTKKSLRSVRQPRLRRNNRVVA